MRLLIALEASEDDEAVMPAVAQLARASSAELVLLNVVNPLADASDVVASTLDDAVAEVVAERRSYLERFAQHFEPPATTLVEELPHGEDLPECIARVAEEQKTDVLVIGTNRASGVRGLILGSVAQHLLRLSPCPILVVRVD